MDPKNIESFLKFLRHDARIPLTHAYNLVCLFEECNDMPKPERDKFLIQAKEEIRRALDFQSSAMELFNEEPDMTAVRIDQPIMKALAYNSLSAAQKNIHVRFDRAGIIVKGNAFMLESIVRNLVANAIKFTPDGGSIIIDAGERGGMVYISVADTGKGLPDELFKNQDLLFSMSEDKVRNGTNGEKGSGTGLFFCRQFAEKMGGTIYASRLHNPVSEPVEAGENESMPDLEPAGTKFEFTVPIF